MSKETHGKGEALLSGLVTEQAEKMDRAGLAKSHPYCSNVPCVHLLLERNLVSFVE